MYSIYLIHWDQSKARQYAEKLTGLGYHVQYEPLDGSGMRRLRDDPPDILIIDLSRQPSAGRDIGIGFRSLKNTRNMPLIFVNGAKDKTENVKVHLPDAVYTDWDNISAALKQAIEHPLTNPVVPESIMAGYSGTPLLKKLGIKNGSVITLINAPDNIDQTLGTLPDGTRFQTVNEPPGDVTLWFIRSLDELQTNIKSFGEKYGNHRLWIIWPKQASSVKSDVTQIHVRKTGLASGLVDYKISSIDQIWSGLLFTKRK